MDPQQIKQLILNGIIQNGGVEEDINQLDPLWLNEIGIRCSNKAAMLRHEFPSWIVEPVCALPALHQRLGDCISFLEDTWKIPKSEGSKRVYVAYFDRNIHHTHLLDLLHQHGLKPCVDGPSYLLGLIARMRVADFPEEIRGRSIVAIGTGNLIHGRQLGHHDASYLEADVAPNGARSISTTFVPNSATQSWSHRTAYLAEKI